MQIVGSRAHEKRSGQGRLRQGCNQGFQAARRKGGGKVLLVDRNIGAIPSLTDLGQPTGEHLHRNDFGRVLGESMGDGGLSLRLLEA